MRKMKNTLILAVMIFCLWITTGLSLAAEEEQPAQGNPANRLEEILQRGKLIVATSPDFAPQEFIDDSKKGQEQYVGSDILMAQYIADQLGVELEIQAMDFAMVLSSVDLGESDMAISGFGWKEDREDSFELSDGFNKTGEAACQGLMIRRAAGKLCADPAAAGDAGNDHVDGHRHPELNHQQGGCAGFRLRCGQRLCIQGQFADLSGCAL